MLIIIHINIPSQPVLSSFNFLNSSQALHSLYAEQVVHPGIASEQPGKKNKPFNINMYEQYAYNNQEH